VKVCVVGAGLGGLSAAIEIAADGHDVEVFEAASEPGGKAGTVVLEGVECDTGPSVLTLPDAFDGLFQRAGSRLEDEVELRTRTHAFRYRFPEGHEVTIHQKLSDTLDSVRDALGPEAAAQLGAHLEYAKSIWDVSAPHFVYGDAPSMRTILKLGVSKLAEVQKIDAMRSMWGAITARVEHRDIRWILARYATYNGSNVFKAPATLNCISWVELGLGGYGVTGGIHAVVKRLAALAESMGIRFHFEKPVEQIVTRRNRARGVRVDGSEVPCDAVVYNGDVRGVPRMLAPDRPHKAPEETGSMSAWNAIVRAKRKHDRPAHSVFFPREYSEEFRDIFERGRPPEEPTIYVCAQEVSHGRTGWDEEEPLFLMANAPSTTAPVAAETFEALESQILSRLVEAGFIESSDRVLWRRTPAELAARFPDSHGSLYGAASNSPFSAFKRAGNRHGSVRGLYLASGTAHPGGGMPLSVLSGRSAARALREDT
jgi:phytoene desaturase